MGSSLCLSPIYLSPITTLDQTCKTLSAERDAPILAPIIQLKFNLMLLVRVPCSCTLTNFVETSTRPEKNYLLSGIGRADSEIVGWAIAKSMETYLVLRALQDAIIYVGKDDPQDTPIIFHSDQGSWYASKMHRRYLEEVEIIPSIIPSMIRKGNCYDNAYVESFFSTLKN